MKDDVFKEFIDDFLKGDLDEDDFKQHIVLFSKFLSYTNPDYKYNSTYLTQYVNDFIEVREWLQKKINYYVKILMELDLLCYQYVLLLDQFYYSHYLTREENGKFVAERDIHYERIEKTKIAKKAIEVKVTIMLEDKEYMICKTYDDFEENELEKTVCKHIKEYVESKEKESHSK